MLKLVGIQRKTGVYEGNSYDNIMLHCLDNSPFDTSSSHFIGGEVCEIIKVRASDVRNVFCGLVSTDDDFLALIGSYLTVAYDRYGRATSISIKEGG